MIFLDLGYKLHFSLFFINYLESGLIVSFLDGSPVNDLPDLLQVGWSQVLILEVVGVLPNIDGEERNESLGLNLVLKDRVSGEIQISVVRE